MDVSLLLKPIADTPTQAYFSDRIQLSALIDWVLAQIGPAQMLISTFSTSEEFLRHLFKLRSEHRIVEATLFCDIRAARKITTLKRFMASVFDSVILCQNHSKVVILIGKLDVVAIVTSQNQTRGDRYEAGIITTDINTINQLTAGFERLYNQAKDNAY